MKCKKCGNNYSIFSFRCPCCNEYTLTRRILIGRTIPGAGLTVDYCNRFFNRVLLFCFLLLGLIMIICEFAGVFTRSYREYRIEANGDSIEDILEGYYEAEAFDRMYEYMDENDLLYDDRYEDYSQAAQLSYYYERYIDYKLQFLELDDQKKNDYVHYLEQALYYSSRTYNRGNSEEYYDRRTSELHQAYQKEILSFYKGTCELNVEEIEALLNQNASSLVSLSEKYAQKVLERRGWLYEVD